MGLDMYVYRIHKPFLDESKVYDRDKLDGIVIKESEIDNPMVQQLTPYCTKVRAVVHYYNKAKIGEDYGLTNVYVGGWSCNKNGSFTTVRGNYKDGIGKSISIPDELIKCDCPAFMEVWALKKDRAGKSPC